MKRLAACSILLALNGCISRPANAVPRPTIKAPALSEPMAEYRKTGKKVLALYRSDGRAMLMHSDGIQPISFDKTDAGNGINILSSEISFYSKALAGRFYADGKGAFVVFENGKASMINFEGNQAPTFRLFKGTVPRELRLESAGDTNWIFSIGTNRVVKVDWSRKDTDKVKVTRLSTEEIPSISQRALIRCRKGSCKISQDGKNEIVK